MTGKAKKSVFILLLLLSQHPVFAQQAAAPRADEIVLKARDEMWKYIETFRNLLSQETKTFEIYGKGDVKNRRVVTSNFIVYQLSKDEKQIAEYRNILAVNGKPLERADSRAQNFFEKIVKVESSAKELEQLQKESQRYDEELFISGMTLFQSPILSDNIRPAFEFTLAGSETIDGSEVFIVDYSQVKPSLYISIGRYRPVLADGKPSLSYDVEVDGVDSFNERVRGRLWIDATTFQIWRERREMTIQPKGFENRIVFSEDNFQYQRSDFGILTPKKISSLIYRIDRKKKSAVKDVRVTFEYQKFTKPDVEVKSADVK